MRTLRTREVKRAPGSTAKSRLIPGLLSLKPDCRASPALEGLREGLEGIDMKSLVTLYGNIFSQMVKPKSEGNILKSYFICVTTLMNGVVWLKENR